MTIVGDLGCPGIDVEQWQKENRVPLFSGKVNRWILVRTLRDNPTPDDLKTTLAATFVKWFEGTPFDPVLPSDGTTRSSTADLIKLERVSKERLSFPQTARRREQLPGVIPTVQPGELVWLEVSFAYRGQLLDMPWPVRTGAAVQLKTSAQCPVSADWILDSAAIPTADAPPERSSAEKAGDALGSAAGKVGDGLLDALWVPLALVGAGLLIYFVGIRTIAAAGDSDSEAA
ncbi:MAG TPA: hypothetical protein VJN18_01895 [Polyangiaceae bacterium]|nr:hypothetical protein [Polyangiaceae bacterium]